MTTLFTKKIQQDFARIVGDKNVIACDHPRAQMFVEERRGLLTGTPECVVFPESAEQVSSCVTESHKLGVSIVPQGGNTGLCGGTVSTSGQVLLSLGKMNKIRHIDADNYTLTAESGCILQNIQSAASSVGRLFPLSLGAEGTCMIGGNLSTNAGGLNVLRYGNARQQVLGLEVVLPDGTIWNGLDQLVKNNTGYDIKHLFIGAEGTLGIITAVVLKLFPQPVSSCSVWLAMDSPHQALRLLSLARSISGDQLSSFELIPAIALEVAMRHHSNIQSPLPTQSPWNVLLQFATSSRCISLHEIAPTFLHQAHDAGLISNAVIADSGARENALWQIREALVTAQQREGASIKHDISVPVSKVPMLIERVCQQVSKMVPGIRPYPFGHMGDGNLHFNLMQPVAMDPADFLRHEPILHEAVYTIVEELEGSFSAEHGIGLIKTDLMRKMKHSTELDLMQRLKSTLDPANYMNPGKVLPSPE